MTKKLGISLGAAMLLAAVTARGATTANVTVSSDQFTDNTSGNPITVIHEGDTVNWHWISSDHSTTSGACSNSGGYYGETTCTPDGTWDSGVRNSGGSDFSRVFPSAGTFHYYCVNHGASMGMVGTISVQSVVPSCGTITLQPSTLPAGVQNSPYETKLTASGGTAPYSFTLASGTPPAGINLDDSGEVSGMPTATGTSQFSVKATDSAQCNATQAYSINISGASAAGGSIVVPGVGSLAGANNAHFKTQIQLNNPGDSTIAGKIVYHAGGASGGPGDPSIPYTLGSWQTVNFDDVLAAMGLSGLGSADIVPTSGAAPLAVVKIFNDDGASGTAGFTEPVFRSQDALQAGDQAAMILPADPVNFRFNLGVRTLDSGISVVFTIWDQAGGLLDTIQKSYPANFFAQAPATTFLGVASLPTNGSIGITVTQGSGLFFGSTVDNRGSQDTSTQFTRHQ
ncbi:MAG TPA: putative Ig domain-containing protein [Thermoanaerobaculia bacterium]|nr:putative Ig domain-containing protein [Thermoanaerobaculia bacterium]